MADKTCKLRVYDINFIRLLYPLILYMMVKKHIPVLALLWIPVIKYGSEVGKKVDPAPDLRKSRIRNIWYISSIWCISYRILPSDVDPYLVGSAFIWVRGSGFRGIKIKEKQSLNKVKLSLFKDNLYYKKFPTQVP